jgi:hypothetical protein
MKLRTFVIGLACPIIGACGGAPPPHLHPAIAREYAGLIRDDLLAPPRHCGHLVEIRLDPRKIADGSPSYYDNTTGELVMRCDNPLARRDIPPERRTTCPPAAWTCGGP